MERLFDVMLVGIAAKWVSEGSLSKLTGCVSNPSFSVGYNLKPRISEHSKPKG